MLCIVPANPAHAATVDMRTFRKEGRAAEGNWIVTADGTKVLQTLNENPTFFISKSNFIGGRVTGNFYVDSALAVATTITSVLFLAISTRLTARVTR